MTVALVTGAARRLGRAMAIELAHRGFDVAIHYNRSDEAAAETAEAIRAIGRRAEALQADLLDEEALQALTPRVVAALGPPRVLVNNASIFDRDTLASATRADWDRHFGSNLRAPFVLIQGLAEHAPDPEPDERGEPVAQALVVNMIDERVRNLTPEFMTYTLSKSALWTLTRTAAQALAPKVRVNGIGPGPALRAPRQSEAHFAHQRAGTLLRRGTDEAGIVRAMRYFLDEPAVTGQMICVDGGQHLGWLTPDIMGGE